MEAFQTFLVRPAQVPTQEAEMKRSGPIKRKTRLKKASKRGLKMAALLKLWSAAVIAEEGARCRAEGMGGIQCGGPLQSHHIFGKGAYPGMKYHIPNGIPCCRNHHLFWVEMQPAMVVLPWLISQVGNDELWALEKEAFRRQQMTKQALAVIMEAEKLSLQKYDVMLLTKEG